jgi:hypothetical protein
MSLCYTCIAALLLFYKAIYVTYLVTAMLCVSGLASYQIWKMNKVVHRHMLVASASCYT